MTGRGRGAAGSDTATGAQGNNAQPTTLPYRLLTDAQMESYGMFFRDIGSSANWSVSSAKYGNGVHQLRDETSNSFWQSDGALPHVIRVEFPRLTAVHSVAVLLSFSKDESYTPSKLSIRAGTHEDDIAEVVALEMSQPNGWIVQTLVDDSVGIAAPSTIRAALNAPRPADMKSAALTVGSTESVEVLANVALAMTPVFSTVLLIMIPENHQQGRDTHARGVKLFGPPLPPDETLFGGFECLR
jgi:anaphase-promoting complex subunit 10